MERKKKVLVAFGTRPEAVKMAPVLRALEADGAFETDVLATAQHREMLDQAANVFGLRIDHDLDLMRDRQTLDGLTARILTAATPVLERSAPDAVLVHGDTTTAFALALASFYRQIPVGHVEAGLRSGNRYSPFPEEMNRRLVSRLATWHYAPTAGNRANLLAEGVDPADVWVTGNTVIDALLDTVDPAYRFANEELVPWTSRAGASSASPAIAARTSARRWSACSRPCATRWTRIPTWRRCTPCTAIPPFRTSRRACWAGIPASASSTRSTTPTSAISWRAARSC